MNPKLLLFISLFSFGFAANLCAQESTDSLKHGVTDYDIEEGGYFNIVLRNDAGIDSVKWSLWELGWTYSVLYYDIEGVINSQSFENKNIICHVYKLFPNKIGEFLLPNPIVWSGGEGKEVILNDTFVVRAKSDTIPYLDYSSFFNKSPSSSIDFNFDCPPNQTCTKAFFVDTLFDAGDTVTLVIGANKYAKFQIPEIRGLRYITHSTTSNTSIVGGSASHKSYIAVKYELEQNLKKIKTPTFKAKIGSRTQYIKKLKIIKPKPMG